MEEVGKEYLMLFNGISNAIKDLEEMLYKLKSLQQITEEMYIINGEVTETRDI